MFRFAPRFLCSTKKMALECPPTQKKRAGVSLPTTRLRRELESENRGILWGNRGQLRSCLDSQGPPKLEGIMWALEAGTNPSKHWRRPTRTPMT